MGKVYVFICQRGDLEIKSMILAISLLEKVESNVKLVAAVPDHENIGLKPEIDTLDFLSNLGIHLSFFRNSYLTNSQLTPARLLTNKIFALNDLPMADKVIFLDSDMICLKKPVYSHQLDKIDFAAKQVDYANEHRWSVFYSVFGIDPVNLRIKASIEDCFLEPYFNSGFLFIKRNELEGFYESVKNIYKILESDELMKGNEYYQEQVSFTLSVLKLKMKYTFLNDQYNYPARSKLIVKSQLPYFAHYHSVEALLRSSVMFKKVSSYIKDYPILKSKIMNSNLWGRYILNEINRRGKVKRIKDFILKQL